MKKIGVLLIFIFSISCSVGSDDSIDYTQELLPIESAILPEEFVLNETYTIELTWMRPSTCHAYSDIYYQSETNERTVAIVASVFNNGDCTEIATELETSFNFKATQTGSYVFKFWQGEDINGEDQYYIVEVPVL